MTHPPTAPHTLAPDASDALIAGWRYRAAVWSVLLAACGYIGFALWSGWHDVAAAVHRVGLLGIGTALALSLVNYALRFMRWQTYLSAMGHPVPWRPSLHIYVAGFALTTTPGKAGEALRGVFLRRWHVPYATSLAAFLSERLSDLLAVVALTLFGLSDYPAARPLVVIGMVGLLAALLVLSSPRLLLGLERVADGGTRPGRVLRQGLRILREARRCHTPGLLAGAAILSGIAWFAEAFALHLILRWMNLDVPLPFAVFVYAISMLAGALSFMPGGLGGAEALMVTVLVWRGIGPAEAVAATVLIRLATLWFAVALGAALLPGLARPKAHETGDNRPLTIRKELAHDRANPAAHGRPPPPAQG